MASLELETLHRGLQFEKEAQFAKARSLYEDILGHGGDEDTLRQASFRLEDMDDLLAEKALYQRIDENARQVLSDIGVNIMNSEAILDILVAADAIDYDNETALFIPLRREYIERCLAQVPRTLAQDPGKNTFGTGATPPFLKRYSGEQELRPASREEYLNIVATVSAYQDIVEIFSLPVACDKSINLFEVAQLMERGYQGLKMITTYPMSDEEVAHLRGRPDWLDGTSLIGSLTPMANMVYPFLRSAYTGNNLLLVDQSIAGISAPVSPEAFLTQVHAQVLFMMVVAQTVQPGITCVHCGIPSVMDGAGNIACSSPHQAFINAALSRLNSWVTNFPSAQTGGATSLTEVTSEAIRDSELSRNTLRKYGMHIVRHALGTLGSLNYFSLEKFEEDCARERRSRKEFAAIVADRGTIPLYFPQDDEALAGIREIAEKGSPKAADHTLKNVDGFRQWSEVIHQAARKKSYYPQQNDMVLAALSAEG